MRTLVVLLLLSATAAPAAAQMTPAERQRLASHLEMTASWLHDEVAGLSPEQLSFRRAPGTWSIAEVIDHLVVVGDIYWADLQKGVKTPLNGRALSSRDADILWYGIDRTKRTTTGEARVPTGKGDVNGSLGVFRKLRGEMKEYAKATGDDLRSRKLLEGNMDVYQWFLMISTHSQRHILQIREIKAHPNYPGS
jgi:hypothetical protein